MMTHENMPSDLALLEQPVRENNEIRDKDEQLRLQENLKRRQELGRQRVKKYQEHLERMEKRVEEIQNGQIYNLPEMQKYRQAKQEHASVKRQAAGKHLRELKLMLEEAEALFLETRAEYKAGMISQKKFDQERSEIERRRKEYASGQKQAAAAVRVVKVRKKAVIQAHKALKARIDELAQPHVVATIKAIETAQEVNKQLESFNREVVANGIPGYTPPSCPPLTRSSTGAWLEKMKQRFRR